MVAARSWIRYRYARGMLDLFHGTALCRLQPIVREGIRPGLAMAGQWNVGWESHQELVYLTDRWAAFYAGNPRAALTGAVDGAVIIRVAIDESAAQLFPDEDYLKYLLEHPESELVASTAAAIGDIRNSRIDPTENRWRDLGFTWERSFNEYGSVATPYVSRDWLIGYHETRSWEEFGIFAGEAAGVMYLNRPFPIAICPYAELFRQELLRRQYTPVGAPAETHNIRRSEPETTQ